MNASSILRNILPPFLSRPVFRLKRSLFPPQNLFSTYEEALLNCKARAGYEDTDLVKVILKKTIALKTELESQPLAIADQATISAALSLILSLKGTRLNVLDFGGACGANYFMIKKVLGGRYAINWNVVETPAMCTVAKVLENDDLKFYNDLQLALKAMGSVDVVYSSGTLQYLPHPGETLKELTGIGAKHMLLTRLSLTKNAKDLISIQESLLSHNGKGPLPKEFEDRNVYYPHTTMQEEEFNKIIHQQYNTTVKFEDVSGLYPVNDEPVVGYGVLLQKVVVIIDKK